MPILRMLGASARYSRLRVPVETGTPPRRRNKVRPGPLIEPASLGFDLGGGFAAVGEKS